MTPRRKDHDGAERRAGPTHRRETARAGEDSSLRVGTDALVVGLGYLASFAYPLVSLPLLARVLGVHGLGRFVLALALVQLIVQLSDFGFGKSALRRIALARTRTERSKIAASSLGGIGLLWLGGTTLLMGIVFLVPALREQWPLYAVGLAMIGVGATYPTWLLQGMGRLRSFALLTSGSRLVALAFLVLTVHTPDDALLAMVWQQFPLALSAVAGWFMVLVVWRDARVVRTNTAQVREALADSWPMFVANLANMTISGSNTVALGIVSSPAQVAFFGAAERFGNAVRGIMHGVVDAMLPRMARGEETSRSIERTITAGIIGTYALAGVTMLVAAPVIVPWYLGAEMAPAALVTQLIGAALILSGVQMALFLRATAQHRFRTVARFAAVGTICHVLLLFPAAWMWGAVGAAGATIVSEGTIAGLYVVDSLRRSRRPQSQPIPAAVDAAPPETRSISAS